MRRWAWSTLLADPAATVGPDRTDVTKRQLFRLFLSEKKDPLPFYSLLADRTVDDLDLPVAGARILDLGCGPGHYSRALARAGATVVPVERDLDDVAAAGADLPRATRADAQRLGFRDGAFDGVFCSNMLEHVPDPAAVLAEVERVVRPGGWIWLSWTNWYSPWGGHAIVPLHYLGPRLGLRTWRRLFGEPKGHNIPFVNLWPTYVGRVLADVRARPGLELVEAMPRYYPSQRWILKVPGLREVVTWNCLLVLRRRTNTGQRPRS